MDCEPEFSSPNETIWVADEDLVVERTVTMPYDYDTSTADYLASHSAMEIENDNSDEQGVLNSPRLGSTSPNKNSSLWQIMRIVSDKQDLSFVEKVHIPEDQILHLCNQILPNSAQKQSPDINIDFNSLNQVSFPVIGLYGHKQMMAEILKNMGVIDDAVALQMEHGKLEPGLYVSFLKDVFFVFYWHQGGILKNASRKEVSCNFIRYVVDLCDEVYACVEDNRVFKALAASVTTASNNRRRTERLRISHVQNSENDVQVSAGFNVNIERYVISSPPPEGMASPKRKIFFAEGYHRCAFISASYRSARKYEKTELKKVKVYELQSLLKELSKEHDLDFTQLSNEDFELLLKHSGLPEFRDYQNLIESTRNRRDEFRRCGFQYECNKLSDHILQSFIGVLPEFCNFIHYLPEASKERVSANAACKESPNVLTPFEHLERQLATVWNGSPCEKKLLFSGMEINFNLKNGKVLKFNIVNCKSPILFDDDFLLKLTHKEGKSQEEKARFMPSGGRTRKGAVMSGEPVILQFKSSKKKQEEGVIEAKQVTNDSLREWVKPLVPKELLNLSKIIDFIGFLLSSGKLQETGSFGLHVREKLIRLKRRSVEEQLLLSLLTSDENLDQLQSFNTDVIKRFLTSGSIEVIEGLSEDLKADLRRESNDSYLKWKKSFSEFKLDETSSVVFFSMGLWKDLCSSVYNDEKEVFKENVKVMIRKDMLPLFNEKLQSEKAQAEKIQEQHFKNEKESFLTHTKQTLSQRRILGRSMRIQKFNVQRLYYYLGSLEAYMHVASQEEEKPHVRWVTVELAPKKRDLDEVNLNSFHAISPSCSDGFELVSCDPDIEDLKQVALLRSGELLVFIHDKKENSLYLYMTPKLGSLLRRSNPISIFRRGFDLVSFDEHTRFLALYDAQVSKVRIYKFDESFRHLDWTGIEIMLELFSGSTNIVWMQCIPGKAELLLVDDTNRARVVELHQQPLMKPKHIALSSDFVSACISGDGSFLFIFQKLEKSSECIEEEECSSDSQQIVPPSKLELKVYMLGDTMSYLKNIVLNKNIEDAADIQYRIVIFGCQIHLVLYSSVESGFISSNILALISATEILEFKELSKGKSNSEIDDKDALDQDSEKSCAALEYIYHIFDKFAVSPALFRRVTRDLNFHVLLKSNDTSDGDSSLGNCQEYLKLLIGQLEKEKGKDFSNFKIQFQVHESETRDFNSIQTMLHSSQRKPMGNWVRQLICLVPIQVTRAENNGLRPLLDGLQIPSHLTYADSISLAYLIRFGLYDAVLNQWDGEIKVISSMGKQSSGKSYLLNHLAGSLLDVAGGRCTDGVWMTIRVDEKCLYILMDFEGIGSFERTEQEDMLLSVLNAAISNLTIFNKKDFHLDKETEAVFQRFQNGVSLVNKDEKLFKGLFYIAIKDVDASDVKDLKDEFRMKLLQICKRSRDNFLTKMYGGMVELAALPPFTRREYHQESLPDMALTVEEELDHSYENGRAFLRDLKLVIAQIAAKDWAPVDLKRVAMKVDILRRNVDFAVKAGCLSISGVNKVLMNFDTQAEVSDTPIKLGDLLIDLPDTGLELAALEESTSNEKILSHLRLRLESLLERKGASGDQWHSTFQNFLVALTDRRCCRVKEWLSNNIAQFAGNNDVQKLQLEVVAALAELRQGLSVCGCKCSVCFWRCIMEKGHSSDHSCMGSHVCDEKCTYCSLEAGQGNEVEECRNLAGHEGDHDCKKKNHTCGKVCSLFDKSSNCSSSCCLKVEHEGPHKCNSPQHTCKIKCSLASCKNPCIVPIELGDHEKHACHERFCPRKCVMKGCPRLCGYEDHFHELTSDEHLCGSEHACPEKCQADGICEIFTELVRQTRTFQGKRSSFEYEHVSEQNGLQKDCCIPIPAFKQTHKGMHVHTLNPDVVHYCKVRCEACGYFCQLPINHAGLHRTVHGNMRNVNFASESEEFEINCRQYIRGESGIAEMCNMHCKAQGRGHIHLISCPVNCNLQCTSHLYDGSRHETRKYGPNEDMPKDELTHETYWKQMRFEDPCAEEDQKEFSLCNHFCKSEEHNEKDGSISRSYCTEELWHAPVKQSGSPAVSAGYITDDGHVFACQHSKNMAHHVVFVIDKSGSMSDYDITPTMAKFLPRHNGRLGCVYEAIIRFIATRRRTTSDDSLSVVLFDSTAVLALEMKDMREDAVDNLLRYTADGGTTYSTGLILAEDVIIRGSKDPNVETKKPTVIFLSDGGNNGGEDPISCVSRIKQMEPRMVLHTIMFGRDPTVEILIKMAESGCGSFQHSLDEVQLQKSFENLATSLQPPVVSLMSFGD